MTTHDRIRFQQKFERVTPENQAKICEAIEMFESGASVEQVLRQIGMEQLLKP